jgi:imidazolonepropionase-like amidohydrolase
MKDIHAKILIDGISNVPKYDQLITLKDNRIVSIKDYNNEENVIHANVVTPGFFNCHVHILDPVGLPSSKKFSTAEKFIYAQKHCEDYIRTGVTTIRCVGTENNYDLEIKEAVDSGLIKGPHMICAGRMICITGGHGWTTGIEADGVDECRKAARTQIKAGVDLIKVMSTGGVMTKGNGAGSPPQFTVEELQAINEEAHKAGRKTATHAQGMQGIKNALYAGIDTIEHACQLDDECIELILKQNTYMVPTLCAPQCIVENGVENGVEQYVVDKTDVLRFDHIASLRKAYKNGVKIACGTDAGTPFNYHNNTMYELELMERYDIDQMDIIKIATRNSAECCGVLDYYGTIEAGKFADLVLLKENPLEAIHNVRSIDKVIKDGKIVYECRD